MPAGERVIDLSTGAARLSVRNAQLVIRPEDGPEASVPLAEIAVLILTNGQVTATQAVFSGMMEAGGAVLVCDARRMPSGIMLPIEGHTLQTRRMAAQVAASLPTRKRLWQQVVREKVRAQATILELRREGDAGLRTLAGRVRSGDPENVEAQAAARYWPILFNDPNFRRRYEADDQNRLLNYGYGVLRSAVGRAICAAGLHPSLGLHHHARNNAWCLADDLMEPYRPLVDDAVCELVGSYGPACPLDAPSKQALVEVLVSRLECGKGAAEAEYRTVFDCISRTAVSLSKVYAGEADRLEFPAGLARA